MKLAVKTCATTVESFEMITLPWMAWKDNLI